MPGFLKQSTASQSRTLGPFIDDTDFKTPETALTINNTDVKLMVNGAASVSKNSGGGTHRQSGHYSFTFDATDTATVGELTVSIVVAGALPVFDKFFVVEEAVYDALFAASAAGYQVPIWASASSTVNLSATTIKTATDVETDTADIQTRLPAALVSGRMDASVGAMAANVLTAAAIAADAITAAKIADGAIDAATFAAGAINAAAIAADAITDAKVASDVTIASVTGAVGSVTGNVGGNVVGSVGSVVGAVGSVTGAVGSVTGLTASDVGAIKAKTDSLTFTVAGQVDSNVQYVNDVQLQGAGTAGNSWRPV